MLLLGLRSTSTTSIISTSAGGRARPPPNYSLFFFPNKFNKKTTLIPSCAPFSSRRKSNGNRREREDPDPETPPKLLVVQPRLRPQYRLRSKLNEALSLANSLQEQRRDNLLDSNNKMKMMPPHLLVQNPEEAHRSVRADMYFGSGTVADVKRYLRALQSDSDSDSQGQGGGLDAVFVNTILSGIQQRNLEMEWGMPVLDRVGLIIEIFHAHAHTKEAMLQSELAALMYKRSRLVRVRGPGCRLTFGTGGEAQVVSARGNKSRRKRNNNSNS